MHHAEYTVIAALGFLKILIICAAVTVWLAGCGTPTYGDKLVPPAAYLMQPPRKFPAMKDGDDAKMVLANAAKVHNREARRIRGLQAYIRTVRGE